VAGFVLAERGVDVLDDRLGVPLGRPAVPVVEADFTAEVQHEGFERRRRVEVETHLVQFLLGGRMLGAEALEVLHEHQRVLLLLEEPDRHESRKVAIVAVVAQEHFGGRQRRPLGNGVHLDGLRLLFGQQ
jgi:hypothetical protein